MIKFKHISEASKHGIIGALGNNMCKYGDVIELSLEHLIKKARNNPDYEEVIDESREVVIDEEDDGEEIRELAKAYGITNVGNKAIKTLLKEIKDLEKAQ